MTRLPLRTALRPLSDLELAIGLVACCAGLTLLGTPPSQAMGKRPQAALAPAPLPAFTAGDGDCAFDSRAALELARTRHAAEFARCRIVFVGNTVDGKPWPAKSWPSTTSSPQGAMP